MTGTIAAYDEYADWYEEYVTAGGGGEYGARVAAMLRELLGSPPTQDALCLDVCCGTGVRAVTLRSLGWYPIGVDLSTGQLRHAGARLPVVAGDARKIPFRMESVDAAVCVLGHTDVEDYAGVVRDAARTIKPAGRFVHIGVHPCFCGYFADWSERKRVVLTPGYNEAVHSFEAWTPHGVRARVGAWHLPLAGLVDAVLNAGLRITKLREDGPDELPDVLGIAAVRP